MVLGCFGKGWESGTRQQAAISKGLGGKSPEDTGRFEVVSPPRDWLYSGCCGGGGSESSALGFLLSARRIR